MTRFVWSMMLMLVCAQLLVASAAKSQPEFMRKPGTPKPRGGNKQRKRSQRNKYDGPKRAPKGRHKPGMYERAMFVKIDSKREHLLNELESGKEFSKKEFDMMRKRLDDLDRREDDAIKKLGLDSRRFEGINEDRHELMEKMKIKDKMLSKEEKMRYMEKMKKMHVDDAENKYELFHPDELIENQKGLHELRRRLKEIASKRHETATKGDKAASEKLRMEKEKLHAKYLKMLEPFHHVMSSARAESIHAL